MFRHINCPLPDQSLRPEAVTGGGGGRLSCVESTDRDDDDNEIILSLLSVGSVECRIRSSLSPPPNRDHTLTDAHFINFFSPRSLISIRSLRIPFFLPFAVFVQGRQFYVFPSAALIDIRSCRRRFPRPSHGVVILAARSANRNPIEMASAAAAAAYNQNRRVPPTMQIQK
ncbi:Calcium-responsive transactivator, partial [Aphis craccivora]